MLTKITLFAFSHLGQIGWHGALIAVGFGQALFVVFAQDHCVGIARMSVDVAIVITAASIWDSTSVHVQNTETR